VLASLTKGGLAAATRSLAIEYAKRGIRANAVSPGIIKSPMHAPETHAALGALHPMGHMGEMSDIVNAILYLDSAPFVTGEILHVDGGQIAGHEAHCTAVTRVPARITALLRAVCIADSTTTPGALSHATGHRLAVPVSTQWPALWPPSTCRISPVMNGAESRKSIASAISLISPMRPNG